MSPTPHRRPVLFLDFDGVLHSVAPLSKQFTRLPLMEDWLRAHPAVDVVISSSWRLEFDLETLRKLFSVDLQPRVIDVTPDLCRWGDGHRGEEVLAWLHASGCVDRPWRAVDDKECWYDLPLQDRLILCNEHHGLSSPQIEKLDAWAASWSQPADAGGHR
jgi:hypothetical protein